MGSVCGTASLPTVGNAKKILKFLDYHLERQGAGEAHTTFFYYASDTILVLLPGGWLILLVVESIRNFGCASPPFMSGMRSTIRSTSNPWTRESAIWFMPDIHFQRFCSPVPIMEPEEMAEFSEHPTMLTVGVGPTAYPTTKRGFPALLSMLCSPGWRNHMVTWLWCLLACGTLADDEEESSGV